MGGFHKKKEGKIQHYLTKYNIDQNSLHTPGVKSILKVSTIEESLSTSYYPTDRSASKAPRRCASGGAAPRRSSLVQGIHNAGRSLRFLSARSARNLTLHWNSNEEDLINNGTPAKSRMSNEYRSKSMSNIPEEVSDHDLTNSTLSNSSRRRRPYSVQFDNIYTRAYQVQVGDNPSVSSGPAMDLSWHFQQEEPMSVEEHQAFRELHPPRHYTDLVMSMFERDRRLRNSGASRNEIAVFTRRVKKAKVKRAETVNSLNTHGRRSFEREEKREDMKFKVQRFLRLRRTETNEQKDLWRRAQKKTSSQLQSTQG